MPLLGFLSPSILWGLGGALAGVVLLVVTWATHSPTSRVALATQAADQHCRADELRTANASLAASLVAEQKASQALRTRISERSKDEIELSARVEALKAENEKLKKSRPDDGDAVFAPDDGWLLRSAKTGTANDPRAKAR